MATSHSHERQIAMRYANALFSLAKEQSSIAQVMNQLSLLSDALKGSKEFEQLCFSPALSTEQKVHIVNTLATHTGLSGLLVNFLKVLTENNRLPLLHVVVEAYAHQYREEAGEAVVTVTSAEELDVSSLKEMEAQLSKALQKNVIIEHKTDATLIAGVTIRYGSLELDASVKGKLAKAAERLYEGIANAA